MKFDPKDFIVKEDKKFRLAKRPTEIKRFYDNDEDYEAKLTKLKDKIAEIQEQLYSEGRHSLLIVLQGMDAAGKDSIVKHAMSCMNPLGVQVTAFGRPSDDEKHHDFLWRAHAKVPTRGKVGIFNRSYYEEVLTVRIHPEILAGQNMPPENSKEPAIWKDRLKDICHFENYLARQGFKIIKLFLHVSKETQRTRLLERIEDPKKNYKVDPKDTEERALWNRYQELYEEAMQATSSDIAPWFVIPADDKPNARIIVANLLLDALNEIPIRLPEVPKETRKQLEKMRRELEKSGT